MTTVHWIVKNNYPLRAGSFLAVFVAVVLHIWGQGGSPLRYTLIVLQLLVYPHLAYWLAVHSADSKRTELRNLTVDCLLWGLLAAALYFPLWITATVYLASTLNLVIIHGPAGWLRSQLAFAAGVLIGGSLWGWQFAPQTAWPVTLTCLFGSVIYMTAIGMASYKRNMRLREIRQALSQRTEELSRTLAQLQQTQAELLEAEKLASLGSLVAGVAHELNTPIGNALVAATALDQESHTMVQEVDAGTVKRTALRQFLGRTSELSELIARSCQRAAKLIGSFKQVAVDPRTEQLRAFDLRELVGHYLAALEPGMAASRIMVRNCIPPAIECLSYPGALGQIVSGLVQNALTHAFEPQAEGTVTLEARLRDGGVILSIRDDGKGMSAEVIKHVFEPFFTTRLGQGQSGLGLTICRNMASGVLGGALSVVSKPGEGTEFRLEFPLQAPQPVASVRGLSA